MCNGGEKKNNYYLWEKGSPEACNGLKHRNFIACDKEVLKFVLQKDINGLLITREKISMKTLKLPTSLNIPQQAVKDTDVWAVRSVQCKGLPLYQRTTAVQSFPQTTLKN